MQYDRTHQCDRCSCELFAGIVSKFNLETLCFACKDDEKLAPNYRKADEAEIAAVRAGDLNFPGIGLAPEDRAFLAARRAGRGRS